MCGESRTHSLEGVVEGRPSTTTLRFAGLLIGLTQTGDKGVADDEHTPRRGGVTPPVLQSLAVCCRAIHCALRKS